MIQYSYYFETIPQRYSNYISMFIFFIVALNAEGSFFVQQTLAPSRLK